MKCARAAQNTNCRHADTLQFRQIHLKGCHFFHRAIAYNIHLARNQKQQRFIKTIVLFYFILFEIESF